MIFGYHSAKTIIKLSLHWQSSFNQEDFYKFFPKGPMLKLCRVMLAVLVEGGIIGYISYREPSKVHSIKIWSISNTVSEKIFKHFSHRDPC